MHPVGAAGAPPALPALPAPFSTAHSAPPIQHHPFSTTHSAPPIHSHSGSAASAVARRYRPRQLAAANQSLTLAARWRFQLPFILVPWRLISLFCEHIPSTSLHYFPHFS